MDRNAGREGDTWVAGEVGLAIHRAFKCKKFENLWTAHNCTTQLMHLKKTLKTSKRSTSVEGKQSSIALTKDLGQFLV